MLSARSEKPVYNQSSCKLTCICIKSELILLLQMVVVIQGRKLFPPVVLEASLLKVIMPSFIF